MDFVPILIYRPSAILLADNIFLSIFVELKLRHLKYFGLYGIWSILIPKISRCVKPESFNLIYRPNPLKYDVFLTHDWRTDERGRDNHKRVSMINKRLKDLGFITWFDEERMTGVVRETMINGIDNSRCAIVFLTKE